MPSSVKGSALYNPAKGHGLWKPGGNQVGSCSVSPLAACQAVTLNATWLAK